MISRTDAPIDVYARVSRAGDDRMRSTSGQITDSRAVIEERGLSVGKVFKDEGKSAWNPRVHRKDWDALMTRLESGESGGVVVFDLARFSRKPMDGERLIAAAERGLLVLDSEGEYDLLTPSGRKAFRDQLAAAAYESDRLSTRVKRGRKMKARAGEVMVSQRPFAFEPDGVTVRESEAEVLREMTRRTLTGESFDALVKDLNARGIPTATGAPWARAGLKQVLTRPRNAGCLVHRGEVVGRLPGDPVVKPKDFDRVVALFASRRRGRPNSEAYLCSGVAHCGVCGHVLTGRPRANMKPYEDGGVKREYWCQPRAHDGGCGKLAIDQRFLDERVGELVIARLADPRHAARLVEQAAVTLKLDTELAELEELAEALSDRLGRREITLSRYDAAMKPIDADLIRLREQRDAMDTPAGTAVTVGAARERIAKTWEAAKDQPGMRRALLKQAFTGYRLVVQPLPRSAPRRHDPARITIEPVE